MTDVLESHGITTTCENLNFFVLKNLNIVQIIFRYKEIDDRKQG